MQKLGVVLPTGSQADDLDVIFNHYDSDRSGTIDYKELSQALGDKSADAADRALKQARMQSNPNPPGAQTLQK